MTWNRQTPERFWARVERTPTCWLWTGARNNTGYGLVGWGGRVYVAHRVAAWLIGLVSAPSAPRSKRSAMHVLHRCDVRHCCNPEHLFLGTYGENLADAYAKNRRVTLRGQQHPNAKLAHQDVETIRLCCAQGATRASLARRFCVSEATIANVIRGRTYVGG